jgi:hypothetical protein
LECGKTCRGDVVARQMSGEEYVLILSLKIVWWCTSSTKLIAAVDNFLCLELNIWICTILESRGPSLAVFGFLNPTVIQY